MKKAKGTPCHALCAFGLPSLPIYRSKYSDPKGL